LVERENLETMVSPNKDIGFSCHRARIPPSPGGSTRRAGRAGRGGRGGRGAGAQRRGAGGNQKGIYWVFLPLPGEGL